MVEPNILQGNITKNICKYFVPTLTKVTLPQISGSKAYNICYKCLKKKNESQNATKHQIKSCKFDIKTIRYFTYL